MDDKKYNWQYDDWPHFTYDLSKVEEVMLEYAALAGEMEGTLKHLPEEDKLEASLNLMIAEAVKTSEIEGEYINREDVRSSLLKNLGYLKGKPLISDRRAEGAAGLITSVRNNYGKPLTEEELFQWHIQLFSYQSGGLYNINAGCWRTHEEPMRVVSGAYGKEKIHYEAPPSKNVPEEMARFIKWFNTTQDVIKHAPVRAAVAHFYFESIHPFEDGNGRIGRAISEKAIFQGLDRPALFSMSEIIQDNKKDYYGALERAQRSNEITEWVCYFCDMVVAAQKSALAEVAFTIKKARFFDAHKNHLNERQLKVVNRILRDGRDGFKGHLNNKKYRSITGAYQVMAKRDLTDMLNKGVLLKNVGGGRSTSYRLNI